MDGRANIYKAVHVRPSTPKKLHLYLKDKSKNVALICFATNIKNKQTKTLKRVDGRTVDGI